jgi:hypothetical protein
VRALLASVSLCLLAATPSWAVLGESVDSVLSDQQRLRGELRSAVGEGFSVHEISSADGTLVREYVSPAGLVFGVSWHGPFVPDLALVLGPYFHEFQQASQTPVRRRGPLALRTESLVIQLGGHMRAFRGRVYLAHALPDALSEAVVQ